LGERSAADYTDFTDLIRVIRAIRGWTSLTTAATAATTFGIARRRSLWFGPIAARLL